MGRGGAGGGRNGGEEVGSVHVYIHNVTECRPAGQTEHALTVGPTGLNSGGSVLQESELNTVSFTEQATGSWSTTLVCTGRRRLGGEVT